MSIDSKSTITKQVFSTPKQSYTFNLELQKTRLNNLEVLDRRLVLVRVLCFLMAFLLVWPTILDKSLEGIWLLVTVGIFLLSMVAHSQIDKRLKETRRVIEYYKTGLGRIAGRWSGQGKTGKRYRDLEHPYSADLDIFGEGSLYELICGVRTRFGEDMLADWLMKGADLNTVSQRQHAIDELRGQTEFRERLASLEVASNSEFNQKKLEQWANSQSRKVSRFVYTVAVTLGLLAVLSTAAWIAGYGYWPLLFVIMIEVPFYLANFRIIHGISVEADAASSGLKILTLVLDLFEKKEFKTPLLQQLHTILQTDGHAPSRQIHRLNNLIQQLNSCLHNQLFAPVAFVLCIPVLLAHRVEQWRERVGPNTSEWFDAVGQFEVLSSLAMYSFENPDDPFPELVPKSDGPYLDADALGHPLIPVESCVRNDIQLDSERRLIMASGSNMSGKSTLLRAIGVNVVLALCGAPVRAKNLRVSQFLIGSSMRVTDSLQQGSSLFYSVISRLKRVVDLAGQSTPLLFLLDEILQGTNSHDRLIGSKCIIYKLVEKNAVGLVTTHDLALNKIADSLNSQAINIHFEDNLANGRMCFDYKIKQGVIEKSNALELMRIIGLNMEDVKKYEN